MTVPFHPEGGRASDKYTTQRKFRNSVPGDTILANKGFDIQESIVYLLVYRSKLNRHEVYVSILARAFSGAPIAPLVTIDPPMHHLVNYFYNLNYLL